MAYVDFLTSIHSATKRDYLARVNGFPKGEAAELARRWGHDYWDGSRETGYGGYRYDGRWRQVARAFIDHYRLEPGMSVLDIGCGKGFLLYDLSQELPGLEITGLDISEYALENAKPEVKPHLQLGSATALPFAAGAFDFVFSLNTLHNLYNYELDAALREMQRVSRERSYLCVESYRSEQEKVNLLYWQLTCQAFCTPAEWEWWFRTTGYGGDHSFIFFE
jgi:protein-L-isoaspartate(D-aspartate) O-methyltransferase